MKINNAEKLGLSSKKLHEMKKFFKDNYTDKGKLAGTQTLISRKGKIIISILMVTETLRTQRKSLKIQFLGFTQ